MAKPKSDILTITEVAEYLKVAERTLYRLAGAKKIPAFRVGGTWRFSRADIDSWIKKQSMEVFASGLHHEKAAKRPRNHRGQE